MFFIANDVLLKKHFFLFKYNLQKILLCIF